MRERRSVSELVARDELEAALKGQIIKGIETDPWPVAARKCHAAAKNRYSARHSADSQ